MAFSDISTGIQCLVGMQTIAGLPKSGAGARAFHTGAPWTLEDAVLGVLGGVAGVAEEYGVNDLYELKEAAGALSAADSGSGGVAATPNGGVTFGYLTQTPWGGSYPNQSVVQLDGSTGYLLTNGNLVSLNGTAFTLMAWVNSTGSGVQYITSGAVNGSVGLSLTASLQPECGMQFNSVLRSLAASTPLGLGWHFVVSRFDGTTWTLKVDDQVVASTTAYSGQSVTIGAQKWNIGRQNGGTHYLQGFLAMVGWWNTALTDAQLTQLYDTSLQWPVVQGQPGIAAVDLANRLVSAQLHIGRSRDTDTFPAGTLTLTLRNDDGALSPQYLHGAWVLPIAPRAPVQLFFEGSLIGAQFFVDDAGVQFSQPDFSTVTVTCSDLLSLMGAQNLEQLSIASGQTYALAAAAGTATVAAVPGLYWPGMQSPYYGSIPLRSIQSNVWTNVAALDLFQRAVATEGGFGFAWSWYLYFVGAAALPAEVAAYPTGRVQFTDAQPLPGGAFGYLTVGLDTAAAVLYSQVVGTRNASANVPGDSPVQQQADNLQAQLAWGIKTLQLPTIECTDDVACAALAQMYLNRYSSPEVRIRSVMLDLVELTAAQIITLVQLVPLQAVQVTKGAAATNPYTQLSAIESVDVDLDIAQSKALMTFGLLNTADYIAAGAY